MRVVFSILSFSHIRISRSDWFEIKSTPSAGHSDRRSVNRAPGRLDEYRPAIRSIRNSGRWGLWAWEFRVNILKLILHGMLADVHWLGIFNWIQNQARCPRSVQEIPDEFTSINWLGHSISMLVFEQAFLVLSEHWDSEMRTYGEHPSVLAGRDTYALCLFPVQGNFRGVVSVTAFNFAIFVRTTLIHTHTILKSNADPIRLPRQLLVMNSKQETRDRTSKIDRVRKRSHSLFEPEIGDGALLFGELGSNRVRGLSGGWLGWFELGNTRNFVWSRKRFNGSTSTFPYTVRHPTRSRMKHVLLGNAKLLYIPEILLWQQQSQRIIRWLVGVVWSCMYKGFCLKPQLSNGFAEWFPIHALYSIPSWSFCNPRGNPQCHPLSTSCRLSTSRHCNAFSTCTGKFILQFKPGRVSPSEFFPQSRWAQKEDRFCWRIPTSWLQSRVTRQVSGRRDTRGLYTVYLTRFACDSEQIQGRAECKRMSTKWDASKQSQRKFTKQFGWL